MERSGPLRIFNVTTVGILVLFALQLLVLRYAVFVPYEDSVSAVENQRLEQILSVQTQQSRIQELQKVLLEKQQQLQQIQNRQQQWEEDTRAKLEREHKGFLEERERFQRLLKEVAEEQGTTTEMITADNEEGEWAEDSVPKWTPRVVLAWTRKNVPELDDAELTRMAGMKLDGKLLLKQKKQDFLLAGFPLGPATALGEAVERLRSRAKGKEIAAGESKSQIGGKDKKTKKRTNPLVAFIGAGYSCMGAAREILEGGGTPLLLEESSKPGGIWIYDSDPKTVSGYDILYAQGQAADANLRNWLIPHDAPHRLSVHYISDHLLSFWRYFGLEQYAQYNTLVVGLESLWAPNRPPPLNWIDPMMEDPHAKQWRVHWKRKELVEERVPQIITRVVNGVLTEMEENVLMNVTKYIDGHSDVDYVVSGTGINHVPRMPTSDPAQTQLYIAGLDTFTGKSIHTSGYRVKEQFRNGSTVIISGGGLSATDIYGDLKKNPTLTVYHATARSRAGDRNRVLNITREENGTFTVYFVVSKEGKADRYAPVHNVDGFVWGWGYNAIDMPVNGKPAASAYFNGVLLSAWPGYAKVGTGGVLASARPQSVYVGRVLTERIPLPDTNTTEWQLGGSARYGGDQYLWHELTSY